MHKVDQARRKGPLATTTERKSENDICMFLCIAFHWWTKWEERGGTPFLFKEVWQADNVWSSLEQQTIAAYLDSDADFQAHWLQSYFLFLFSPYWRPRVLWCTSSLLLFFPFNGAMYWLNSTFLPFRGKRQEKSGPTVDVLILISFRGLYFHAYWSELYCSWTCWHQYFSGSSDIFCVAAANNLKMMETRGAAIVFYRAFAH